jgi:hypothetical protein
MSLKLRARNAALGGLLLSVALFLLFLATFGSFVYWQQVVGIYVCELLRSIQRLSEIACVLIVIPTNALIYALVIFGVSSLVARRTTPS